MAGFPTIETAFIKQYGAEVKLAYQRTGSKLRAGVRSRTGVIGASTVFQKFGKGKATTKARHATVPPMNVDRSNVECFLQDWYAGDYIDKLDLLKTNVDERQIVASAGAYALGRKSDEIIVTALESASSTRDVTGTGDLANSAGITKKKILKAVEMLNAADVPDDGQRYGVLSPQGWTNLMDIPEFVNADYIGERGDLPYGGGSTQARTWLGIHWTMFTGLADPASNIRNSYIWHKTAVGHAVGAEIAVDFDWEGARAAWFVNHMMSQGACLVDETGLVRIKATEA